MTDSKYVYTARRLAAICGVSISVIAAAGIVDGYLTHRWTASEKLLNASSAVDDLPHVLGDWRSADHNIPEQQLKFSGATGYVSRVYTHVDTHEKVSVLLLCGPHGPISLHPPTTCFAGAGWQLLGDPQTLHYSVTDDVRYSVWHARFRRVADLRTQTFSTQWAWNNGSGWTASTNPRFEFAGSPYLFKLYITSDATLTEEDSHGHYKQFVTLLLKEFDDTVIEPLSSSPHSEG